MSVTAAEGLRRRPASPRASADATARTSRSCARVAPADRRARCSRATGCRRACLQVDREHLELAEPQAVVINSGVANAATGERGKLDALATAAEAGRLLGLDAEEVLVLSTGVIGARLPLRQAAARARAGGRRALGRTAAATRPRRS